IVPKQFLKRVERTGFGPFLFHDWRYRPDGSADPAFELNRPEAAGATILLAGANFGCGSSREHAVWALQEYGFRAILAESFADIFYANCCQNGLLPVRLGPGEMRELFTRCQRSGGVYDLLVDLEATLVKDGHGFRATFAMDPYRREMLLRGRDEIDRTLLEADRIAAGRRGRPEARPRAAPQEARDRSPRAARAARRVRQPAARDGAPRAGVLLTTQARPPDRRRSRHRPGAHRGAVLWRAAGDRGRGSRGGEHAALHHGRDRAGGAGGVRVGAHAPAAPALG